MISGVIFYPSFCWASFLLGRPKPIAFWAQGGAQCSRPNLWHSQLPHKQFLAYLCYEVFG